MSAAPSPAPTIAERPSDDATFSAALLELVDIGLRVARAVGREADRCGQIPETAPTDAATDLPPDRTASNLKSLADSFDHASRAVRRTILLARHVAQGDLPQATPRAPANSRAVARRRIIREVEDAIERRSEGETAESLHAELSLRLDGPDLEDDIESGRPIADIIADIRRDLGLSGNHRRRTPREIQDLYARAAAPTDPARAATPIPPAASADDPPSPASKSRNRKAQRHPEKPNRGTPHGRNEPDPPQSVGRRPPRGESPAESLLHYLTRARGT